jgi:Flp pilus assembly protein TadD
MTMSTSFDAPPQGAASAASPRAEKRGIEALYATGHWLLSQERASDAAGVFRAMALLAPDDERSWLALGAAHEALEQPDLALEMYGTGHVLASPSILCGVARARVLRRQHRDAEADLALDHALRAAEAKGDDALVDLVVAERSGP